MTTKVLVVEDERIVALDLCQALEEQGYQVVGSESSGERVVQAAQRTRPDIVLMDVRLQGGVDGIEAAGRLRVALDLPVVFLTAQVDPQTVLRIHELGAEGYLVKPVRDQEIGPVLQAALRRHRESKRVRERGDELWVTLQSIADAVLTVASDERITYLNPAAERLFGVQSGDARGRPVASLLDLRDGRCGPAIDSPVRLALREGETVARPEGVWLERHGDPPCAVGLSASPVHAEEGGVIGAVVVLHDLSERERMRELLSRADRLSSLGLMAASIAHEINNPLTYILANIEQAVDTLRATDLDPLLSQLLVEAASGAHAIEQITRDLKLLSTQEGRSREDVEVRSVVQRSLRTVARGVRTRGRLESALATTGAVLADPVALGQVVWNLVLNANQALPKEYCEESVVRVSTFDEGAFAVLRVEDNGSGIPADVMHKIFDPFFTTKPVGQGSGLGLAVTQQIVDGLGGRIEIESTVGVGTSVRVLLPLHDLQKGSPAARSVQPEGRAAEGAAERSVGRAVLVIDDDRLVRRAVTAMLSRAHRVESVATVEAAVALLAAGSHFDAILCDLMMSPLNGLEFYEILADCYPDLVQRIAFITGGVISGDLQDQVLRTGRPLAYKPFARGDLLHMVEALTAP